MNDDPQDLDLTTALGLAEACRLMRGRGGKAPNVTTLRRWANPQKGCRPQGKNGPQLVLRTIKMNGELLTFASWVADFEQARVRLGRRGT